MKSNRILLIISIILISLGSILIIFGTVLTLIGNSQLGDILMGISSLLGVAALAILIFRLVLMSKTPEMFNDNKTNVVVKIVDVKDLPKTREQQLYEQYEDLYKKNLITKEELEIKRKDLLGK